MQKLVTLSSAIWDEPPIRWLILIPLFIIMDGLLSGHMYPTKFIVYAALAPAFISMIAELIGYGLTMGITRAVIRDRGIAIRACAALGLGGAMGADIYKKNPTSKVT